MRARLYKLTTAADDEAKVKLSPLVLPSEKIMKEWLEMLEEELEFEAVEEHKTSHINKFANLNGNPQLIFAPGYLHKWFAENQKLLVKCSNEFRKDWQENTIAAILEHCVAYWKANSDVSIDTNYDAEDGSWNLIFDWNQNSKRQKTE